MSKLSLLAFIILCCSHISYAQTSTIKTDTTTLQGVTIRGYLSTQPVLSVPASVSVITPAQLKLQPENSLIPVFNTVPGVRAEERSPGSYRLSIRGSLLRSPFGVRNVKVYYDDVPLTDAGGNTYLNALDFNSVQGIEILKGPDGSLFGANSGGVVLINPVNNYADNSLAAAGINTGSYGLFHENVALNVNQTTNRLNVNQAYQTYGGYREHSNMDRHFIQAIDKFTYNGNNSLKALAFYSDLQYQTPGGLTYAQAAANPQSARLPTKTLPGAIEQQIGVTTKMLLGGLVNEYHFSDKVRNVLSVFGSYVDFSNPFITNYEQRYEGTYGFRTYFEFSGDKDRTNWKLNVGLEWQQTNADDNNYGNNKGVRDTAQTLDEINTNQHFIFARYAINPIKNLHVEAATSLNYYNYKFRNVYPLNQSSLNNRSFDPQLMPRLALSYQLTNNFIWRASVSRGYSTPTIAEVRPTDNVINTSLQPEYGWNYETGFRLRNADQSMFLDASIFYYHLQNAIVRQLHPDETEYYINAGGTNQPGIEVYFSDWLMKEKTSGFIRGLQFNESITLNRFKFSDYQNASGNYSGNQLTGVPNEVLVSSVQLKFPSALYLFVQHNYTARIPLNDGNTVYASHYNLLQAKAGWKHLLTQRSRLELYAGADNILNQKYSLGNDLNAVGNRYYNPSALRNYYIGLNVVL